MVRLAELSAGERTRMLAAAKEMSGFDNGAWVPAASGKTFEVRDPSSDRVIAHCADKLAAFKVPRYVEYLPEFPHTTSGKIAKSQLEGGAGQRARKIFDRSANAWR